MDAQRALEADPTATTSVVREPLEVRVVGQSAGESERLNAGASRGDDESLIRVADLLAARRRLDVDVEAVVLRPEDDGDDSRAGRGDVDRVQNAACRLDLADDLDRADPSRPRLASRAEMRWSTARTCSADSDLGSMSPRTPGSTVASMSPSRRSGVLFTRMVTSAPPRPGHRDRFRQQCARFPLGRRRDAVLEVEQHAVGAALMGSLDKPAGVDRDHQRGSTHELESDRGQRRSASQESSSLAAPGSGMGRSTSGGRDGLSGGWDSARRLGMVGFPQIGVAEQAREPNEKRAMTSAFTWLPSRAR